MSTTNTFQLNNFTGTRTSPAFAVPAGATGVEIDFTNLTNPAITVKAVLEFAPDGVTWQLVCDETFVTGGVTHSGVPITTFTVNGDLPAEGSNRQIRGTLTVTGGKITTPVNITTTP